MIWDRVQGHDRVVELFRRSLSRNRMSHAWLFAGPDGVGKRLFARTLAQCLFCERHAPEEVEACGECAACRRMQADTHPDYLEVGAPPGKSVLPLEVFSGPPERRGREGLCYEISLRPMAGDRRIAVIDDASLMNPESANALLKTLEEPPPFSMMILIATDAQALLPTIRSRCQMIRFAPLSDDHLTELLIAQQMATDPAEARTIAGLSEGSLATAGQLLDPSLRQLRLDLYEHLSAPKLNPLAAAEALKSGLDAMPGEKQAERQAAVWLIRFALEFYRRVIRTLSAAEASEPLPQVQRLAERLNGDIPADVEHVMALLERTAEVEGQIKQMQPVPLCLEAWLDDLSRMSRRFATPLK